MGRLQRLTLAGIVVAAAALRFSTLGVQSLDFDEAYTVGIVGGSLGHVWHQIPLTESTPPLYYLLGWLWSQAFGVGAVGLRALSALLGTLTVGAAFLAGRRLADVRAGLGAALLVAVNPAMVWYSQEARSYALLAFLCALTLWAFACALERPGRGPLIAWVLLGAAALATHYFAGFLVAVEAAWLLWRWRERWTVSAAVAAVAATAVALLPLAVEQAGHHRTDWIEALSLPARVREVAKKWLTGEIAPISSPLLVAFVIAVAVLLALALRHADERRRRGALVAAGVGLGTLLLSLMVDLAGAHYLISKNEFPALIVLLIAAGAGLAGGWAGWLGTGVTTLCFLGLVLAGDVVPAMQRADYRDAARAMGPRGRDEVVVTPPLGDAPLAVYRPGAAPVRAVHRVRVLLLALPLPRADSGGSRLRTPPAPPGFRLAGRLDARRFSLACYLPAGPREVPADPPVLSALGGGAGAAAQTWPGRPPIASLPSVCAPRRAVRSR